MGQEQPATKKRVVLGELHIIQNAVVPANNKSSAVEPQVQKRGAKAKAKKALTEKKTETPTTPDIDSTSDDPQMCGPYARDIYDYLHKLEVRLIKSYLSCLILEFIGKMVVGYCQI